MAAKIRTIAGLVGIFLFAYCANELYNWTKGVYAGETVKGLEDYPVQLYFFAWIGYAVAAALAVVALYCIYYFIRGLVDVYKEHKHA